MIQGGIHIKFYDYVTSPQRVFADALVLFTINLRKGTDLSAHLQMMR